MYTNDLLATVVTTNNLISPALLADRLRITQVELAASLGLSRDSVSKKARLETRKTQTRLRDMLEIVNRVVPWCGSELAAFAWYRSQALPSFGDRTAEALVVEGQAAAVKRYLDRIAEGGHA